MNIKKKNTDVENIKVIYFLQISKGKIDLFQSTVIGKNYLVQPGHQMTVASKKKKKKREKSCV